MAILERIAAGLMGTPVALPEHLVRQYPALGAVRFRRGGLPPRVGGWLLLRDTAAAITLWNTVWLAPGVPFAAELLLHELRHVHQFQASLGFPIRYLWESIRRGYSRNRFEVDARQYAATMLRAPGPELPGKDS